jgi:hypothetical protein
MRSTRSTPTHTRHVVFSASTVLQQFLQNALAMNEKLLISSAGVHALTAVDRAAEAMRCSSDSTRGWSRSPSRALLGAAVILSTSAKMFVNMLIAEQRGARELAELWKIAAGLPRISRTIQC